MYIIKKRICISAAHWLELDYPSKCSSMHGHNWVVEVWCKSDDVDANGMVVDFSVIGQKVSELDHIVLNERLGFNPTAENIARWVVEQVPFAYKCCVWETEDNMACYEEEV